MDEHTRKFVRLRALERCEYCHLPQSGRASVAVLRMNAPERVRLRQALMAEGLMQLD